MSAKQASAFHPQVISIQWASRNLAERLIIPVCFPHRESDGKLFTWNVHKFLPLSPNTNFLKHTICPGSQPAVRMWHLKGRLQSHPCFASLLAVAVQWITLFHVLKQDSNYLAQMKCQQCPQSCEIHCRASSWSTVLQRHSHQIANRQTHLSIKDTSNKLHFLGSLI